MTAYNKTFELDLDDMDLIEAALRRKKRALSEARLEAGQDLPEVEHTLRDIHELLGRLHNQKQFYRPKAGVYVGG